MQFRYGYTFWKNREKIILVGWQFEKIVPLSTAHLNETASNDFTIGRDTNVLDRTDAPAVHGSHPPWCLLTARHMGMIHRSHAGEVLLHLVGRVVVVIVVVVGSVDIG